MHHDEHDNHNNQGSEPGERSALNLLEPEKYIVPEIFKHPSSTDVHVSRRCGARTRRGTPCQSPAMKNVRCRIHGGLSPGAPKGNKNADKHGRYAAEAIARRREVSAFVRATRTWLREL